MSYFSGHKFKVPPNFIDSGVQNQNAPNVISNKSNKHLANMFLDYTNHTIKFELTTQFEHQVTSNKSTLTTQLKFKLTKVLA